MHTIDLNADIGESSATHSVGDDAALVPLMSSANIACGGHAGDAHSMAASVALCLRHGVAIGAHPSFPDREGFGRRRIDMAEQELRESVREQVVMLAEIAGAAGARLRHVKPHGALYNIAAVERGVADTLARALRDIDPALVLVGLAGSQLLAAGTAHGLATLAEGFADRRYTAQGTLVPRNDPRALIEDAAEAEDQVLRMITEGAVLAVDGTRVPLHVDTVCLHGDGAHAVPFAKSLRQALRIAGIAVAAP